MNLRPKRPFDLDLQVQRIDLLYTQNLTAPLINVAAILWFFPVAWNDLPHSQIIAWAGIVTSLSLIRLIATFRWRKRRDQIASLTELGRWHAFMACGITLSGLCYGYVGVVSVNLPAMHQIYLAFFLIAACSGSCVNYSASLICSRAALFAIAIPWAIGALLTGGMSNNILAAEIAFYALMHLRVSTNLVRYANQGLALNLALYEKEQRLRIGRDSSGAMDWTWDIATQTFCCEGQLDQIFGQSDIEFSNGLNDYIKLVHQDDQQVVKTALHDALLRESLDIEHRVLWPNGEIHHLSIRGRTEYDKDDQPVRMLGIAWDVTAKKTEERLRFERDAFDASNKAKLVFLANASHEIRTPLAAINGFAEMIMDVQGLPYAAREDVKAILRNGKYLASVVNDLLDLSKADSDHLFMQKTAMSPIFEIIDALQVVQAGADRKGLKLQIFYETLIPEIIHVDATRFRQILINLLSNSVKYTDMGLITVSLGCTAVGKSHVLSVVVADTGMGISQEAAKHLFQPFVRGNCENVQRLPGSGLGLALSRSLARQMGGELALLTSQNDLGGGCSFMLTIDAGELRDVDFLPGEQLASRHSEQTSLPNSTQDLRGRKIMVAEDDADLRELMQRFLMDQGASVITCANGKQAVERALRSPFHSIVMDIKMPVMDGYEATSTLRDRGYRNPIIALTAHASVHDRQLCFQAGCNAYLSKPVDTKHLLEVLVAHSKANAFDLAVK